MLRLLLLLPLVHACVHVQHEIVKVDAAPSLHGRRAVECIHEHALAGPDRAEDVHAARHAQVVLAGHEILRRTRSPHLPHAELALSLRMSGRSCSTRQLRARTAQRARALQRHGRRPQPLQLQRGLPHAAVARDDGRRGAIARDDFVGELADRRAPFLIPAQPCLERVQLARDGELRLVPLFAPARDLRVEEARTRRESRPRIATERAARQRAARRPPKHRRSAEVR